MAVDWTPFFENLKEELKKLRERDRRCDMERLTYGGKSNTAYCDYPTREIINKLAEYEQAEEEVLLIRLEKKGDFNE